MEDFRIILIKILQDKYVDSFLDGNIYMNSLCYFSDLESKDAVRSDRYEGIIRCEQIESVSILSKDNEWIPISGVKSPITFRSNKLKKINIFCLYAYTDKKDDSFSQLNLEFGSTAIIIKDANEFTKRMRAATEKTNREIFHGPITYVDKNTYSGNVGPFFKFKEFSYQNEFRFCLMNGDQQPFTLKIGDLRDIVLVAPSNTINKIPKPAE